MLQAVGWLATSLIPEIAVVILRYIYFLKKAGPEPTNDLKILIELGVRPENIWAFEIDKKIFPSAVDDIERTIFRDVKLMNVSIEDYFLATPNEVPRSSPEPHFLRSYLYAAYLLGF